jgi:hypothetical protein
MLFEINHSKADVCGLPMFRALARNQMARRTHFDAHGLWFRRTARLSAETGARFVRDRINHDPLDWLLSPKTLFGGRSPARACRTHHGFATAMLLHEYSLGLDCPLSALAGFPRTAQLENDRGIVPPDRVGTPAERGEFSAALFTFVICADLCESQVQIFGAMVACSGAEVRARLRQRYGPVLEDEAIVRLGFDWSEPLACAMVSEAMAHVLQLAAEDPSSPIAIGLDFQVEQRFVS